MIDGFFEREPIREERPGMRSIDLKWVAAEDGDKVTYVVFTCSHSSTGRIYYSGLSAQTEQPTSYGGTSVSFGLFQGVNVSKSDVVKRFSQKALAAFAEHAFERLLELKDDERIVSLVESACEGRVVRR
jgi:hypothetical protein